MVATQTLLDFVDLAAFIDDQLKLSSDESPASDGWDEDWGDWNEDKQEEVSREATPDDESEVDTNNESNKWLQDCNISISPAGDIIAMAKEDRLVLLARKSVLSFV